MDILAHISLQNQASTDFRCFQFFFAKTENLFEISYELQKTDITFVFSYEKGGIFLISFLLQLFPNKTCHSIVHSL